MINRSYDIHNYDYYFTLAGTGQTPPLRLPATWRTLSCTFSVKSCWNIVTFSHSHILSEIMLERCYILTGYQSVKAVTTSHLEKEVLNDPTLTATLLWVWRIHQLPDQVFSSKIELLNSLYENKNPPDASLVYLFENFKLSDFLPDNLCVSPLKSFISN